MLLLSACAPEGDSPAPRAPAHLAVTLSPEAPRAGDVVTAAVAGKGDDLVWELAWSFDGAPVAGGRAVAGFAKGQTVRVEAVARNAAGQAGPVSAEVEVANTPPVLAGVAVTQQDGLRCEATATDADGDAVEIAYAWTVDGEPWGDVAAVPADELARGLAWTCTATPDDGNDVGLAGVASVTLSGPAEGAYAFRVVADVPGAADLAALPDGTLLVATLLGTVAHVDPDAGVVGEDVLTEPDDLISIALDPDFGDGDHDFLYTWTNRTCLVQRWPVALDPFAVGDAETLVELDCPLNGGHAGGDLLWWTGETESPTLYLAVGPTFDDGAQDGAAWGNRLLAFAVDRDTAAVTPAFDVWENPYTVALGLRNPWRLADCGAAICVADPGSTEWEEIDLYAGAGANFGYPYVEGPGGPDLYEPPAFAWHDDDTTWIDADRDGPGRAGFVNSPFVGVRASGRGYGGRLDGWLLFGEIYDGWVRALRVDDAGVAGDSVAIAHTPYILGMVEAPDGTIYAADMSGAVHALVLRADRDVVAEEGAALPAYGGVGYTVRHPLWSDGAGKDRVLELPAGGVVRDGVYPDGTRVWKTFDAEGVRVETRVIEKRDGRWVPGVYVWEGDAAALSDGRRVEVSLPSGDTYVVPSTQVCVECHEATRGREWPLGLDAFQLGEEGIAALAGAFDPALEAPAVDDTLEGDVRGYLHGNCAYCHQPGAVANMVSVTQFDFRHDAEDLGVFDVVAQYWHANPNAENGLALVTPGSPDDSALVGILEAPDMPPLLVSEMDRDGVDLLRRWIGGME
ncbi:MAG: hypothetical protein ACOZNI_04065 [Myxococcota bacterium]